MPDSAFESVDAIGIGGLRRLAGELGVLRWNEPPERGFWATIANGPPQRVYTGCLPTQYGAVNGETDSVWIEWSLVGPRTQKGQLEAVSDQLVTALCINRSVKTERADRSNRVVQILSNDPVVHYPAREEVPAAVPETPIELSSHHASVPAQLAVRDGAWKVVLTEGDRE